MELTAQNKVVGAVVSERFPIKSRPELDPKHPRALPRAVLNGTIGIGILHGNPFWISCITNILSSELSPREKDIIEA